MQMSLDDRGFLVWEGHIVRHDIASNKGSVIDVILALGAAKDSSNAQTVLKRVFDAHPELDACCTRLKINNKGRETPVADAGTLLEIVWLCPGKTARETRRHCAKELCRLLAGDLSLVDEIERRHEQMAGTEAEAFLQAAPAEPAAEPPALPAEGAKYASWQEARAASAAVGLGPAAAQTWEMVDAAAAQANRSRQQAEAFEYLRAMVEGEAAAVRHNARLGRQLAEARAAASTERAAQAAQALQATRVHVAALREALQAEAEERGLLLAAPVPAEPVGSPVPPPGDSLRDQANVAAMFLADTHGARERSWSPTPRQAQEGRGEAQRFIVPALYSKKRIRKDHAFYGQILQDVADTLRLPYAQVKAWTPDWASTNIFNRAKYFEMMTKCVMRRMETDAALGAPVFLDH